MSAPERTPSPPLVEARPESSTGQYLTLVGVTPDGRCSFVHFECLGACEQAPMMMVDDTYHGDLDAAKVKQIVEALD